MSLYYTVTKHDYNCLRFIYTLDCLQLFIITETRATPVVTCPAVCPLHTATYTCISSMNGTLLQWQFRNATTNTFLGALQPTYQQPKIDANIDGVFLRAELNQTVLLLLFNPEHQAENIRISCCDLNYYNPTYICSDCMVTLAGIRILASLPNINNYDYLCICYL